ncbi:pLS20_p028 family conjugation system transmembrane protein [Bacillus subtilis]
MSDEDILKILKKFSDVLEIGNIFTYILRWLGWSIVKALAWMVDGLEGVTDDVLSVADFFKSKEITDFLSKIQPGLWIILALSLCFLGYQLIFNKKFNREHVLINIVIAITVIMLLGQGMKKADDFSDAARKVAQLKDSGGSTADKVIKDNLTDISLYDDKEWKSTKLKEKNKIPKKNIQYIDITEKIDKNFEPKKGEKLSKTGKKVLEKKLAMDAEGNEGIADLKNGWFDFFPEQYYRWQWDYWTMLITLLVTGATLLFISIKLSKLIFELAFNHILASILAYADIASGQKLKEVLKNIGSTFFIFIMVFVSMRVYLNYTAYISEHLNGVAFIIALIAGSLAVIDGPVMCERIFGIDAGLKSGWGLVAGGYAIAKSANGAMGGIGNLISKGAGGLGSVAMNTGAGLAGAVAGMAGSKSIGQENKGPSLNDQMKGSDGSGKANGDKATGGGIMQKLGENGKLDVTQPGSKDGKSTLQDEMNKDRLSKGKNTEGNGLVDANGKSNVKPGSLQEEMSKDSKNQMNKPNANIKGESLSSLQDEMRETGAAGANIKSAGNDEAASSLQDEMRETGAAGADIKSAGNDEAASSLQDEMRETGAAGADIKSTGNDEAASSLQDEMRETGAAESVMGSTNGVSHEYPSSLQEDANESSPQVGGNNTPSPVSSSVKDKSSTSIESVNKPKSQTVNINQGGTVQPSTSEIPLPNYARTEQRTIGEYTRDKFRERINNSPRIQSMKKSYHLSKNTVQSLRNGKDKSSGLMNKNNLNSNSQQSNLHDIGSRDE